MDKTNRQKYSIPPAEDELPVNILLLSNQFPFNNVATGSEYLLEQMRALLPPLKEAWRLCELYFDNCAWLYVYTILLIRSLTPLGTDPSLASI